MRNQSRFDQQLARSEFQAADNSLDSLLVSNLKKTFALAALVALAAKCQ